MASDEKQNKMEDQINNLRRLVDYTTLEYPVEVIVQKYTEGEEDDENEIFVPQYQRDFVWSDDRQSKFIESLLLGLPIPFLFVADVTGDNEGRLEIVDGSQRIRTLSNFVADNLKLCKLKKLTELNGVKFSDLSLSRQRRFNRTNIRIIQLTDKADASTRIDIFERINTTSDQLKDMEVRRGLQQGPFMNFVEKCGKDALFKSLAPVSARLEKRHERTELVLRFFAYLDSSEKFEHRVDEFLNEYVDGIQQQEFNEEKYEATFQNMLNFISRTFDYGFRKTATAKSTPRVRFETLAVGAALALQENPNLVCRDISWIDSEEFRNHTRSDGSNSRVKLRARLQYAKERFLEGAG